MKSKLGKLFICSAIGVSIAWFPSKIIAITVDSFLPPAQAETDATRQDLEQIRQPDQVKENEGIDGKKSVEAATSQDAINTAIKNISVGGGCEEIKFPSGFGFVATGCAVYGLVPNPTANLVAQRQAYQVAYLNAKKNLTQYLHGLSTSGQEQLMQNFKTVINDTDTLANLSESTQENITELVNGLIKGYVVYSVDDEHTGETGNVTVSIVTTPKTLGAGNRISPSALTADSVRDGLSGVLAELSNGLLSPVGGKVISVPQTGELAFVGFGSAVVPSNPNKAAQAKLALNAQKVAQMRARSALCGIILGDTVEAASTLDTATQAISRQFDEIQQQDPTVGEENGQAIAKLQNQQNSFVNTQFTQEQISSFRRGGLPPGVNIKTFFNPEKTLASAVAVYLPSVSLRASDAATSMKDAELMENSVLHKKAGQGHNLKMPPRGASGQISNPNDL